MATGLGVLAALAAGCGSGGASSARPTRVTMRDFYISAPAHVPAGRLGLAVTNLGPDTHELLVARAPGRPLPRRSDGLTVDEHALGHDLIAGAEAIPAGASKRLTLRLAPGRYVLFCNMTGHYAAGMRRVLVVG